MLVNAHLTEAVLTVIATVGVALSLHHIADQSLKENWRLRKSVSRPVGHSRADKEGERVLEQVKTVGDEMQAFGRLRQPFVVPHQAAEARLPCERVLSYSAVPVVEMLPAPDSSRAIGPS